MLEDSASTTQPPLTRWIFVTWIVNGALCGTWNETLIDSPQYAIASKRTLLKFSTLTRRRQPQWTDGSERLPRDSFSPPFRERFFKQVGNHAARQISKNWIHSPVAWRVLLVSSLHFL
jgi:hypothetical protein